MPPIVAKGLASGLFRYGESELDTAVQAEILLESARNEARVAILELLLAIGFGVWLDFNSYAFRAVAVFTVLTVAPLLVDAKLRRSAAKRLLQQRPAKPSPPHGKPGGPSPGR